MPKANKENKRKAIRLSVPLTLTYFCSENRTYFQTRCEDISPEGIRFADERAHDVGKDLEIKLEMSGAPNPVHLKGTVVWSKRTALTDGSGYLTGVKFSTIEEDNKNTFLKFMCDRLYAHHRDGAVA